MGKRKERSRKGKEWCGGREKGGERREESEEERERVRKRGRWQER